MNNRLKFYRLKYNYIKSALVFILIIVSFQCTIAQEMKEITPMPYQQKPYYDRLVKNSIKQVVIIRKLDAERSIYDDTTSIQFYDKDGKERKCIKFEKNKRNEVLHFNYRDSIVSEWWNEENLTLKKSKSSTFLDFDLHGKVTSSHSCNVYKGDTLNKFVEYFYYDSLEHLYKNLKLMNKNYSSKIIYKYTGNYLVSKDEYSFSEDITSFTRIVYIYNQDNSLSKKIELKVRGNIADTSYISTFNYAKNNLVYEKNESKSGRVYEVTYEYDSNNLLSKMRVKKDTIFGIVEYEYSYKKLFKVKINTNNPMAIFRYYSIPFIREKMTMPLTFEENYKYNERGNLIEKITSFNEKVKYITQFYIDYY